VTGAGSGVGQGIIKALRVATLPVEVITTDISPSAQGLYRGDEARILPPVEADGALAAIIAALRDLSPDAVLIGSEFDLEFFARHRRQIEEETHAIVVVADQHAIGIADDKWATAEFLRKSGLPHPRSAAPGTLEQALSDAKRIGFPLVIKPRSGTSNRNVHIVRDAKQLAAVFDGVPNPVLQELIAEPSNRLAAEYTCSVFRCADGALVGPFTARRTLRSGNSWVVEVRRFEHLHPLLISVAERLPCMGTLNIQLMIGPDGPIPFEFNARFSGTTAVRAHFGFNEPEMSLRSYVLGEAIAEPSVRDGLALRYLEEVFLEDVQLSDLGPGALPKGTVVPWF
jgi:carbamoyl-phosphate synthase large subunit